MTDSDSDFDPELEENLDIIDPLRHLRNDDKDIVPAQPPSIHNQIVRLQFPPFGDHLIDPITVTLAVDAAPGCGGIAWPAGEVSAVLMLGLRMTF